LSENDRILFVSADMRRARDCRELVDRTLERWGRVDILFNNVGTPGRLPRPPLVELPEEDWDDTIAINLKSVYLCSKAVVPHMIEQGGGVIVNNASMLGIVGLPESAAYCASKGGVVLLTRSMALELIEHNIRVNCIAPGLVKTDFARTIQPPLLAWAWRAPRRAPASGSRSSARAGMVGRTNPPSGTIYRVVNLGTALIVEDGIRDEDTARERLSRELGRVPGGPRHGPRPVDVDLLLLGDLQLATERLTLPHPQVTSRRFVLVPLLELEPELALPDGTSLRDALDRLGEAERVERVGAL
jgi:NAD(P)-dependent dehydrogenase (short-subunit alcohol dehydrogenase family)